MSEIIKFDILQVAVMCVCSRCGAVLDIIEDRTRVPPRFSNANANRIVVEPHRCQVTPKKLGSGGKVCIHIVDKVTGAIIDAGEYYDRNRECFHSLCRTNIDGFALDEEGIILLTDSLGNYECIPDAEHYKIHIGERIK